MLSQDRLIIPPRAVKALALILLAVSGCRNTPTSPQPPAAPPPMPKAPKVVISESYDKEIAEILDLAKQDRWEEAQAKANALYLKDKTVNPIVMRVHIWVDQQAQLRRAQKLEDKIREIDAKNSVFNPTFKSLLTEQKDRGLPPRKDVRNAVDQIENTPYIPESYGHTVHEQAPNFEFESTKGRMFKALEKEITVHLENITVRTLLMKLSEGAGVSIVADNSLPALTNVLNLHFANPMKLGDFFRYLGRNYDLQFQTGPDVVWVVDAKDPKHIIQETRFYNLRKGFILPAQFGAKDLTHTVTKAATVTNTIDTTSFMNFVNDQASETPSLEKAIKELEASATNALQHMIDYEHNKVMARGTPEMLDALEKIIREFDQPIQQVFIEARFVTISKPAFMQLGVLWETGRNPSQTPVAQDFTGIVNPQNFPQTIVGAGNAATPALGIGIQNTFTRVFGAQDLSATISALEQSGESQTLSAPRLTVLNNRPARVSDGLVQYYYDEYQVFQTAQAYYAASSFVPSGKPMQIVSGAELNVLASISGDGKSIVLALNPRVNTDVELVPYATLILPQGAGTNATFTINLPQYRTEELATRMVVKSGQTVVMGGVLDRERYTLVESVPVLGDLPLLGTFFRRRTEVDTPSYLLVFVTATIVKDTGEYLIYDDAGGVSSQATNIVAFPTNLPPVNPLPTSELPTNAPQPIVALTNTPAATLPAATPPATHTPPSSPVSTNAPAKPK